MILCFAYAVQERKTNVYTLLRPLRMKELFISVVVPVFNVETYLEKCLESIMNQTYRNIEIILVDDGSTDNSGKICDNYAKLDNRITVIHKNNGGVSAARNDGMHLANGDYICFVDSDDWLSLDYIELASTVLIEQEPSVLINNWISITDRGKVHCYFNNNETVFLDKNQALLQLAKNEYYDWCPFATFYEANECKKLNFDGNIVFGEDLLFKYNFIKSAKSKIIYQPLYKYFYLFRNNSAVNSYSLRKRVDDIKVLEYIIRNENNEVGSLFYKKKYLPQLVHYSVMACFSKLMDDKIIGKEINKKIITNLRLINIHVFIILYIRKTVSLLLHHKN